MKDRICIYEKFGFCRNGASCKFTHPTLVCDDQNCNIQECTKRHPQACRFFTTLKYCKFGESCKFLHKRKPDKTINNEEYKTLEGESNYAVSSKNYFVHSLQENISFYAFLYRKNFSNMLVSQT